MNKSCLIVDLGHSLHGQIKRVRVSYKALAYCGGVLVVLLAIAAGLSFSYLRMSWRVSQYERMRADLDHLRFQYVELQRQARQHEQQMASLESLASEVSVAYGIHSLDDVSEGEPLDNDTEPNLRESIEKYNSLESASLGGIFRHYAFRWQTHNQPSLWPVAGVIRSSFGRRSDPFSGEGAFHTGVDLQALSGTPVYATADGVVGSAGWSGRYGKRIVLDHGNGLQTYYAHLSRFAVMSGEEVRKGEVIAYSGSTGHATGPHLHYEVRLAGNPVNPYRYLAKAPNPQSVSLTHSDLGL